MFMVKVENWFAKFNFGEMKSKVGHLSNFDDDALKSLVKSNRWKRAQGLIVEILNTLQSTICRHLEKIRKISKLDVWILNKNKSSELLINENRNYL